MQMVFMRNWVSTSEKCDNNHTKDWMTFVDTGVL